MGCVSQLGMPEVYDLVQYLINQYEVLPDSFLRDLLTKILDNDDDPVEQLQDIAWTDIMASGRHNVNR